MWKSRHAGELLPAGLLLRREGTDEWTQKWTLQDLKSAMAGAKDAALKYVISNAPRSKVPSGLCGIYGVGLLGLARGVLPIAEGRML